MCYLAALQDLGIAQTNTEKMIEFETAPCPLDTFNSNWAKYPGNNKFDLKPKINIDLKKLCMIGKVENK